MAEKPVYYSGKEVIRLMKNRCKKTAASLLSGVLLTICLSVGFSASAEESYVFTENFDDNQFPKAVSVYVQSGDSPDKCFGFTNNPPMVESMPDARSQVMMKNMTAVESSITYEFKDGFSSFEYIGYGGGRWGGIYGKTGIFKIQWSDSLGGTYRDFQQIVVGPNKGKTTSLSTGEMTLDRPDQESAGLAYFYSNKIPSSAKYLRLWFMASPVEGDSFYENWMAALVSLNVRAYGSDPNAATTTTTTTTTTKAPTTAQTTNPTTTARTPANTTANGSSSTQAVNATTEGSSATPESTTGYAGPTDEFGRPITTTTTSAPVVAITSSSDGVVINESWKTITVSDGTTVGDLAGALTIASGYEIRLFDGDSNQITSASALLEKDMLVRLYQDQKVALTYTINVNEAESGFPLWAILLIIGGVVVVAGVVLLIVFRKKIFKART